MALIEDQDLTKSIQGVAPAGTKEGHPEAANRVVAPNETVQGQLKGLITENAPFIQQARTNTMGEYNRRGLLNSGQAVSAGEQAAYAAALPVAAADADKYSKAGDINVQNQNLFGMAKFNEGAQSRLSTQEYEQTKAADWSRIMTQLHADTQTQGIKGNQAAQIAQIEANYKTLMQASDSASKAFAQTSANIQAILSDANIPAANKQAHVDQQINLLRSALAVIGGISNLDLDALLTF
jgi:hypothetical protein